MTAPLVMRASVLFVDDDALMLRTVERTMYPYFDVSTVNSVRQAMQALQRPHTFAVIVSDLRMPGGDGVELLQYARARHPDVVRVMLSGVAQLRDAISAVNDGHVFRFLTKPFDLSAMRMALTAAIEQHRLICAERVLLEETLKGSINAIADMLAIVQPMAFGRGMRMRQHASELAEQMQMDRRWEVEVSALLSQIGCVTLEAITLHRWYHNEELSPYERDQVDRLPAIAEALIADIPRMETVRTILRRQFEWFDADLPIGAAILAIVRDYDVLITEGRLPDDALSMLDSRGSRYGKNLMNHFRALRGSSSLNENVEMPLSEVRESMIFAADLHSANGLLLIARGQAVTAALMARLQMQSFALERTRRVRMIVPGNS